MSLPANQLLAYHFDSGSSFEGQLVGALERLESGGTMRVLDALFVAREPDSGQLVAVSLTADGSAGMIGRLLDFRLDPGRRAAATKRALEGSASEAIGAIGDQLEPGTAFAAVLVEHTWAQTLGEAIGRIGGSEAANEFTDASRLHESPVAQWSRNPR